jgi:hypothetical protein
MLELGRPVRERADQQGIDEVDTRRIRMMSLMVFHRSSFPESSCGGGDADFFRDRAHGPNWLKSRSARYGAWRSLLACGQQAVNRLHLGAAVLDASLVAPRDASCVGRKPRSR